MSINDVTFNQTATLLNEIVSQATGRKYITPVNREQFVAVGQVALKCDQDELIKSISQVMQRTIFSVRPYKAKLSNLQVSTNQFGNMTRKLTMYDSPFRENQQYSLEDGKSVDMYTIHKEKVLQLNFYNFQTYSREMMIWRNQLNVAFTSPEEFIAFLGMKTQNVYDQIVKGNEEFARQALCNLIYSVWYTATQLNIRPERCVHCLSEYKQYTGDNTLTVDDILKGDGLVGFAQWFYGKFASTIDLLAERSILYHQSPTIPDMYTNYQELMRHTPKRDIKCYFYSPILNLFDASVHSVIFHNEYLNLIDYEPLSYWQDILPDASTTVTGQSYVNNYRATIMGESTYLNNNGELKVTDSSELNVNPDVIAVLIDRDACGYSIFDEHETRTPWNAAGDYAKIFFKYTNRYWNDFTENIVIFTLD